MQQFGASVISVYFAAQDTGFGTTMVLLELAECRNLA